MFGEENMSGDSDDFQNEVSNLSNEKNHEFPLSSVLHRLRNCKRDNLCRPIKKVIYLAKSVLYPPQLKDFSPKNSKKPLGCKTVRVSNLPEGTTEDIVREIFETCGEIETIQLISTVSSYDNYAEYHIRFSEEKYVTKALDFSGYEIEGDKRINTFTRGLRVEFYQTDTDRLEYHKKLLHADCSGEELTYLIEILCDFKTFDEALNIVVTWLNEKKNNKKHALAFYWMIQIINVHMRYIMSFKTKFEDVMKEAQLEFQKQIQDYLEKFNKIKGIFDIVYVHRTVDYFSEEQRKNIEMWKKHAEEIIDCCFEELSSELSSGADDNDIMSESTCPKENQIPSHSKDYSNDLCNENIPFASMPIDSSSLVLHKLNYPNPDNLSKPNKEIIHLTKSVLYPPQLGNQDPQINKPFGCKTVCVNGFPERTTEEIITEVFETCGDIESIKFTDKYSGYAIRFSEENYANKAFGLSGYTIRIGNKNTMPFIGELKVLFYKTEEDKLECHKNLLHADCSTQEVTYLIEILHDVKTFDEALSIVLAWLNRKKINGENASALYSMIQIINDRMRGLMSDKTKCEDVMIKAKLVFKQQMQHILAIFNKIKNVFDVVCMQRTMDYFTERQRKNINMWKKHTEEIMDCYIEELSELNRDDMNICKDYLNDSDTEIHNTIEQQKSGLEVVSEMNQKVIALDCKLIAAENESIILQNNLTELTKNSSLNEKNKRKDVTGHCDEFELHVPKKGKSD